MEEKIKKEDLITVSINDQEINGKPGQTILELALENNIFIPHLCFDPRIKAQGACRLCLVEVEGLKEAVPSCITKISPGMEIKTNTKHIKEIVKLNLELILSDHPLDCLTCESCGNCTLQDLAYLYDVDQRKFIGSIHTKKVFQDNPFVLRDNEKCILCGRCVRICDNLIGANAIGYAGRGFECEIIPAFEQSLKDTECVFCGNCISTCPVGALQPKQYLRKARYWETKKVQTTCPYCGVGCQIDLHIKDNKIVNVTSDIGENINKGSLCVKGKFGLDFVSSDKRLTSPLQKRGSNFENISWEDALDSIASQLKSIIQKHGPDSIGILSSAKCTNEENFLLSKFARAAIGTNNIDHCARLCHASTITGLIPTFGSGAMTNSFEDIKDAKAAIVIGSNTTEAHPVISYELINQAVEGNLKLIVIDPRKIPLTKYAHIHLQQRPGTDIAVLMGLMNIIYENNLHDREYIEKKTENFGNLAESFKDYTPEKVEELSGVDKDDLIEAAKVYGSAKSASIYYSMGITQHTCGTENVISIANLSMMTGNIGKRGGGVNPLRGQNNVQGACDLGALPNVYSGYQYVEDENIRHKFESVWGKKLPPKKGLTVTEMIDEAKAGNIKALYIMGENPMLSDPDILHVAEALENLELLVVQDIFITETGEFADFILPSTCFAEKNGTFTNTDRRIQRVNKALDPPGKTLEDWKIICMLSEKLGYSMEYESASEIMDEIAKLTPIYSGINFSRLDDCPLQWPCTGEDHPGTDILHAKNFSRGKGRFMPVEFSLPAENPDNKFPYILTTGRILYHFHTRTMSGKSDFLNLIAPMALAHINEIDAKKLNIKDGDRVKLETRRGEIEAVSKVDSSIKEGVVFIPFHFADSPANKLTNPALDPKAKIPEYKACAVKISKV
ncbi:MAG: formate dehydrogenase subunit alpha [Actinomycetota bacterium]